ncbi:MULTISPECIES: AMIN-like domain-containing (lipo)protein [unclassified Nocardioides]|uniref:AMIN-like domain-containing (lipo)protein n=1 Tax=unclassified Nocardioides TaxID=2615069 RepID=UPI0006F32614|nr:MULTISPECIES: hypothetical protein [unclassified Nocardioides]KRA31399.1 hypothetical protein ASD81_18350 [Nocardioides sp. Root614]KRA88019.1 hypothetical protein ASD84_18625 [Nocardioides sp. Root682]
MNTSQHIRRIVRLLVLALALSVSIAPLGAVTSTPTASASACAAQWGSLAKARSSYSSKQITNVRSGRHACFDRLVIDVNARGRGAPGYVVKYVKAVTMDASGAPVPLRGGARLQIIVRAPAYDANGKLTYRPANRRELVDVAGYRTFRQVAWAGTFEGQTTIGLGVRARLPMRVFVLSTSGGGHRLVVDVAHRWY